MEKKISPQKLEILKKQNLFHCFLKTLIFSKLTNVKSILFTNIYFEQSKVKNLFEKDIIYIYYIPENLKTKKPSYLWLGIKEENFNKNFISEDFFKKNVYINNYIDILLILSDDILLKNFDKHWVHWLDQEFFAYFLDWTEGNNFFLKNNSGFIPNFDLEIISEKIFDERLKILNININTVIENQLNFLSS